MLQANLNNIWLTGMQACCTSCLVTVHVHFWVHILNHEFKSQIAMRTMVTWHDVEKSSLCSHVTHLGMY